MPRWYDLTNEKLVELTFKVMVSRVGKTSLNVFFDIMTHHLNRLISHGYIFSTAEELYNLLVEFPLRYSKFHLFEPKRDRMIDWSTTKNI